MAKVVLGGGVAAISGKVGGAVFARNKGGAYMRTFVKPTNPSTVYQEESRDRLTQYSNEWRTLTDPQRNSWNAWAATHPVIDRLGASKLLSGAQAYVKVNTNRDLAGDPATNSTVPSDPVWVTAIVDTATDLVADISDGTVLIPLGAGAAAAQVVFVYATGPISPGISNFANIERLVAVVTLSAGNITDQTVDVAAEWTVRMGPLTGQAGRKIGMHAYQYLQGQTGSAYQDSGIIVA